MKQLLRQIFLSAFTLLCLITAGCSTITEDQFNGQSAQMIYTQGQAYLENEDYSDAIIAFQALNAQYPFSPEAKRGNLGLIYAYFQHGDPALSPGYCQSLFTYLSF
jgi:outer membrane protein assembly factor BamD (BamD/ComL family)